MKAAELILAILTALWGLRCLAVGLKKHDEGTLSAGVGFILCGAWILLRTL